MVCAMPEIPELDPHDSIGVGAAMRHGVTQRALRDPTLRRPFWGVRSVAAPSDPAELVRMYGPRLRPGQLIGELSAARLHGLPLPAGAGQLLHVAVQTGAYRPASRGVSSRSLPACWMRGTSIDGLPVLDPVTTWLTLARSLDVPSLVVVGDALVTAADNYPGLRGRRPLATLDELEAAVREWSGLPGIARLRLAAPRVRTGVESPMETPTRLIIVDHGFDEPEINGDVRHEERFVARPDLLFRHERVAVQYDGDGHRDDRAQWQADVDRDERLRAIGWEVLHVTQSTLETPGPFLRRLGIALARGQR